jgi:hypothetical protein
VAQLVVAVTDSPARASSPLASLGVTHCP